jgi:Ca2+-binding RTX toxin-like protein
VGGRGHDLIEGFGAEFDGCDCETSFDEVLKGGWGNDRLIGGPLIGVDIDNQMFVPGPGNDVMTSPNNSEAGGGTNYGTYFYYYNADVLDLSSAPGPVVVDLAKGEASGQGVDTFTGLDTVIGSPFDDVVIGSESPNVIFGGDGSDELRGNAGDDLLLGEAGDDLLRGGPGDDRLEGAAGDDRLLANEGDDLLNGGEGLDEGDGGSGRNRCVRVEQASGCEEGGVTAGRPGSTCGSVERVLESGVFRRAHTFEPHHNIASVDVAFRFDMHHG